MKPTDSELSILHVLWKNGPSTVRHVNTVLNQERPVGYTNTLKIMQIMHSKGFVTRDESSRSHIYSPAIGPETVKRNAVSQLVNTLFEGSTSQLLLEALGQYSAPDNELNEIRRILENLENDQSHDS